MVKLPASVPGITTNMVCGKVQGFVMQVFFRSDSVLGWFCNFLQMGEEKCKKFQFFTLPENNRGRPMEKRTALGKETNNTFLILNCVNRDKKGNVWCTKRVVGLGHEQFELNIILQKVIVNEYFFILTKQKKPNSPYLHLTQFKLGDNRHWTVIGHWKTFDLNLHGWKIWKDLSTFPVCSSNYRSSKINLRRIVYSTFRSWDIKIFVIFSLPFHIFQIQKDKWNWNNLGCHDLARTNWYIIFGITQKLIYITSNLVR